MRTSTANRQRLLSYLAEADTKKVNAVYKLLEKDIDENLVFALTDEHLNILEKEQELHRKGLTPSYNREEARNLIRSKKAL